MTKRDEKTFRAVPDPQVPGDKRMRLITKWCSLPAGTYIRPLYAGQDNVRNEYRRTVAVVSGERAGEKVTGPY